MKPPRKFITGILLPLYVTVFCLHAESAKPNIIIIFTDDHGWADLGVQGMFDDVKTPHTDQLAESGWPVRNGLQVQLDQDQPRLISPSGCWSANDFPTVSITAAFKTDEPRALLLWKPFDSEADTSNPVAFNIVPDGKMRTYTIKLKGKPGYEGSIQQFILQPSKRGSASHFITLQKFELIPAND